MRSGMIHQNPFIYLQITTYSGGLVKIFDSLKYEDFKKIWLSQVFSQIALNVLTFALVLHIYELTNKTTSISLVMIASALPVALLGPFSGVLADKVDYRKILLFANLLRVFTCILLIFSINNVLGILEIIFIISALSQIFTPAESSSIPILVPREKIISANSLVLTTTYATLLLGYSVSGPLLKLIGPIWLFLICALLYLAATWKTWQTSNFDKKVTKTFNLINMAKGITHVWGEVKEGANYLKNAKNILEPIIKLTIGWTVLGVFITLLPAYGKSVLGINPEYIGPAIIGPAGLGLVLSAGLFSRKKKFNGDSIMQKGFVVTSAALLLFSLYRFYSFLPFSIGALLVVVVIMGYGSGMIQIAGQTLLHLNTDEDKRGRVFAFSSMQLRLATTLPSLFVGVIADWTSPFLTMFAIALLSMLYTLFAFYYRSEPKRTLEATS